MKGILGLAVLGLAGGWAVSAVAGPMNLKDEGVGAYSDPSVACQYSAFTLNRSMVSCAVGTITGCGMDFTGPFAMLMYAKDVQSYNLTRTGGGGGAIRASGRMRSITNIGGLTVEDVDHNFIAIGEDNVRTGAPDRFTTHFVTPFWSPGNPFCTPSDVVVGGF